MRILFIIILSFLVFPVFGQHTINWLGAGAVAHKINGNLHPRVKLDRNRNPMVVWGDVAGKIWFAKWGGETFSAPVSLSPVSKAVFATSSSGPDMAAHGDTVYVVYKEMPLETGHIYIRHSYDGGLHFSAPEEVDKPGRYIVHFPTVSVDETGNPFVTYMRTEMDYSSPKYYVARSTDLGESFVTDTQASVLSGNTACECSPASYVASGSAGVLLYRNNIDGLRNIWAGISNNGGVWFNNGLQIDSTYFKPDNCPASAPHGVIVGDTLYMVYMSGIKDTGFVYLNKLSLSKPSLTASTITGYDASVSMQNFPRVSGIGIAGAVVWTQTSGGNNYVCLSFTDDLTMGFPPRYDTVAEGVMLNADVAIGGGYVYVVWEDLITHSVMYRKGVYIKRKTAIVNTSILINQPEQGQKYFAAAMAGLISCQLVEESGMETELDLAYPKANGICHVSIDDINPGKYPVRFMDNEGNIYTAQLEVK